MEPQLKVRPILPAALLNFLAGLYAATGIGLLTSLEISGPSDSHGPSAGEVAIDALAWVAASVFQAWSAHLSEKAEQEANLVIDSYLTPSEREKIRADKGSRQARRFWILMGLTAVCVAVAVVYIIVPNVST